MTVSKTIYKVAIKDVDFKNMPNGEEFYFCIDLVGNKKVHRCKHIKTLPSDLRYVLLDKSQLTEEQKNNIIGK